MEAYSGTKLLQPRKRKGSEEKKREFEDMVVSTPKKLSCAKLHCAFSIKQLAYTASSLLVLNFFIKIVLCFEKKAFLALYKSFCV